MSREHGTVWPPGPAGAPVRKNPTEYHDWVPGALGIGITVLVALATITPYFYNIPKENMNLITQAQTTLWNGWMVVLAYYYGSSKNQARAQDTMNTQAETARQAGAALAAVASPPGTVVLGPGQEVTVEADVKPSA